MVLQLSLGKVSRWQILGLRLVRQVGRRIFRIFLDLDLCDPGAIFCLRAHHGVENSMEMLREAFTGGVG
jgi:hypothetical protein